MSVLASTPLGGTILFSMTHVIWENVPDYEGYYEVSNLGAVRSYTGIRETQHAGTRYKNGKMLMPKMCPQGYLSVGLSAFSKKTFFRINVLVARVFIPNPDEKPFVDHINGIPWDNRVENLRWCTQAENVNFSYGRATKPGQILVIRKKDFEGNILKEYPSVKAVEADGYGSKVVNRVVLNQRTHAYGFRWDRIVIDTIEPGEVVPSN